MERREGALSRRGTPHSLGHVNHHHTALVDQAASAHQYVIHYDTHGCSILETNSWRSKLR